MFGRTKITVLEQYKKVLMDWRVPEFWRLEIVNVFLKIEEKDYIKVKSYIQNLFFRD